MTTSLKPITQPPPKMITFSLLLLGGALLATASPAPQTSDPYPDCALVDCISGLTCTIINNVAACVAPGTRQGPQCGYNPQNRCPAGETCCNPSCGICTPPGKGCIKLLCQRPPKPVDPVPPLGTRCGPNVCASDQYCCNESCGYCREPGKACTEEFCLAPKPQPIQEGPKCGPAICAADEYCCNSSCGYCRKPGKGCTRELCVDVPVPPKDGPKCGPTVCAADETCCNESCGYCTEPGSGKGCTKEYCLSGPKCGTNRCAYGEECCNDSCGYCVKPGQGCTEEYCFTVS